MEQANTTQGTVPVRDAATTVILRDGRRGGLEVLLLRRHRQLVFGGGADVFPGGAVDGSDAGWARESGAPGADLADAAWRMAACRECFEEAGLLFGARAGRIGHARMAAERRALNAGRTDWAAVLRALGVVPDLTALVAFDRWTTPPGYPKRYATRFYARIAPPGQAARADGEEVVAAQWVAPETALGEEENGQRQLMTPTRVTLERLTHYNSAADALDNLAR